MFRHITQSCRVLGYGYAFAVLGLGGFFLAITVFPVIGWVTADPVLRQRRVQTVIQSAFRLYLFTLRSLQLIHIDIIGAERLQALRGAIIVANHPSLLDVVLLMSITPRAQCVVKYQLWDSFFLRSVVRGARYIRNDLDALSLVGSCVDELRAGNNLIIFPEGTRTVPGKPIRFRRGVANIATLAPANVQLVTITCSPSTLTKGEPWYRVPATKPRFALTVGQTLDIREYLDIPFRPLAARRLRAFLERCYTDVSANGQAGTGTKESDRAVFAA
jgi:1-acyl-sn-glycerol-3-phosphate acyltransferase